MLRSLCAFATLSFSLCGQSAPVTILTEHLAPFQIVEQDGTVRGTYTHIIESTFTAASVPFEIHSNPWAVSYTQATKDNNTCLYSVARIPSREGKFLWIGELGYAEAFFYSSRQKDIVLNTFDDAKRFTVAAIQGDASYEHLLAKGFEVGKNLYPVENYDSLITLVSKRADKIDLIMLTDVLLTNRLDDEGGRSPLRKHDNFRALDIHFYLACNLGFDPGIASRLQGALKQHTSD